MRESKLTIYRKLIEKEEGEKKKRKKEEEEEEWIKKGGK